MSPTRGFLPNVLYSPEMDTLTILWKDGGYFNYMGPRLGLYKDLETEEIIGVEISSFDKGYLHAGVRIDVEYDQHPPLRQEELEMVERILTGIKTQSTPIDLFAPELKGMEEDVEGR